MYGFNDIIPTEVAVALEQFSYTEHAEKMSLLCEVEVNAGVVR